VQVTFASSELSEVVGRNFRSLCGRVKCVLGERKIHRNTPQVKTGGVSNLMSVSYSKWNANSCKIAVVQVFFTHRYSRSFILQKKLSHLRVSTQSEQIHEFEKNVLEINTGAQCFHNMTS